MARRPRAGEPGLGGEPGTGVRFKGCSRAGWSGPKGRSLGWAGRRRLRQLEAPSARRGRGRLGGLAPAVRGAEVVLAHDPGPWSASSRPGEGRVAGGGFRPASRPRSGGEADSAGPLGSGTSRFSRIVPLPAPESGYRLGQWRLPPVRLGAESASSAPPRRPQAQSPTFTGGGYQGVAIRNGPLADRVSRDAAASWRPVKICRIPVTIAL